MKKLLIAGAAALVLIGTASVQAETVQGKVLSTKGNTVTIQQKDGTIKSLTTTDNTTYRKKKMMKKNKMKHGQMLEKGKTYYEPLMEEDDWIEIVYTPTSDNEMVIEDVTVYDD